MRMVAAATALMMMSALSIAQAAGPILRSGLIYERATFPSAHASTIAETKEGLVAAWFGGTKERHPDDIEIGLGGAVARHALASRLLGVRRARIPGGGASVP
jgi:hypothetical protein